MRAGMVLIKGTQMLTPDQEKVVVRNMSRPWLRFPFMEGGQLGLDLARPWIRARFVQGLVIGAAIGGTVCAVLF